MKCQTLKLWNLTEVKKPMHKGFFSKNAIEKDIIDIKLSDWPVIHDNKTQYDSNCAGFTTRLNVSKKFTFYVWWKPLATDCALHLDFTANNFFI